MLNNVFDENVAPKSHPGLTGFERREEPRDINRLVKSHPSVAGFERRDEPRDKSRSQILGVLLGLCRPKMLEKPTAIHGCQGMP